MIHHEDTAHAFMANMSGGTWKENVAFLTRLLAAAEKRGMLRAAEIVDEQAKESARIANKHDGNPQLGPLWTAKTGALSRAADRVRAAAEQEP